MMEPVPSSTTASASGVAAVGTAAGSMARSTTPSITATRTPRSVTDVATSTTGRPSARYGAPTAQGAPPTICSKTGPDNCLAEEVGSPASTLPLGEASRSRRNAGSVLRIAANNSPTPSSGYGCPVIAAPARRSVWTAFAKNVATSRANARARSSCARTTVARRSSMCRVYRPTARTSTGIMHRRITAAILPRILRRRLMMGRSSAALGGGGRLMYLVEGLPLGGTERQHLVQARQREEFRDFGLHLGDRHLALPFADALEHGREHAQRGAVEVCRPPQVDHNERRRAARGLGERFFQARRRVEVHLARHVDDGHIPIGSYCHIKFHGCLHAA